MRLLVALMLYNQADEKLPRFQSLLKTSYVSRHTDELWYNEPPHLGIAIYIYIYICVLFDRKYNLRSWLGEQIKNVLFSFTYRNLRIGLVRLGFKYFNYCRLFNVKSIVVWISGTERDRFYHWWFSKYCLHLYCYFHDVSGDKSSSYLYTYKHFYFKQTSFV